MENAKDQCIVCLERFEDHRALREHTLKFQVR